MITWLNKFRVIAKDTYTISRFMFLSIILYAYGKPSILQTPSVTVPQLIWNTCEDELYYLDLLIKSLESTSISWTIDIKYLCQKLQNTDGKIIKWSDPVDNLEHVGTP